MNKAIVLLSGGMDSLVTLGIARRSYDIHALHVNYGQRTERRENIAFRKICDYYGITKKLEIDISHLLKIGGSALTDKSIRVPTPTRLKEKGIPITYVPFRNTNIIAIAVSWAEVISAKKIFIGAVEEDSSGYPDCREKYYKAFNQLIRLGTKPGSDISIATPLIHMSKSDIVRTGMRLKVPFHLSWSCYSDNEQACGRCASCLLRLNGFKLAGLADPIPYRKRKSI
jgi:7-cyano-7-deazaguanine synthase